MDHPITYTIVYVVRSESGSREYESFAYAYEDFLNRAGSVELEQVTTKLILRKGA
jgi:hypothetical protein